MYMFQTTSPKQVLEVLQKVWLFCLCFYAQYLWSFDFNVVINCNIRKHKRILIKYQCISYMSYVFLWLERKHIQVAVFSSSTTRHYYVYVFMNCPKGKYRTAGFIRPAPQARIISTGGPALGLRTVLNQS